MQINRNWSKRTESRMNVAPSPSQETVALLLCEFNIHVKLTHVIHGDHALSTKDLQMRTSCSLFAQCVASYMDPRITCKRADLVTMVAFVGLFPRVWKCVAWLSQKPWTLTNACVWFPFHTMSCSGQPSDQNGTQPMKVFERNKRRTNSNIF